MDALVVADHLPAGERFAFFRDNALTLPEPVELRCSDTSRFAGRLGFVDLGGVAISTFATSGTTGFEVHRPARLIRRSDPEAVRLLLNVDGDTGVDQAGRRVELGPGEIGLYDTSLPLTGWRRTRDRRGQLAMADIPRRLLPLPADRVRRLVGTRLTAMPFAALTTTTIMRVCQDAPRCRFTDRVRLAHLMVDLVAALLASALDPEQPTPHVPPSALLRQVQVFIEARLGDRDLGPATIAAAHHMSLRTLHRLFAQQGVSVGAWIRQRRLERCRRDLIDPHFAHLPIRTLAARWGFADHAHLTRAFVAAYGTAPRAYRQAGMLVQPLGAHEQGGGHQPS